MSVLDELWAKSPRGKGQRGEALTSHLAATLDAARAVERRIGRVPGLPDRFWTWVALAALTHDAGKVADGFQDMVNRRRQGWDGHRHEVLSLGFLPALLDGDPERNLPWVALGVAAHHRAFFASSDGGQRAPLAAMYPDGPAAQMADAMGPVRPEAVAELHRWLADTAEAHKLIDEVNPGIGPSPDDLFANARHLLTRLLDSWREAEDPEDGHVAVLLQAAVTMSDHVSSAHGTLDPKQPLDRAFRPALEHRLAAAGHLLRLHQTAAARRNGHLLLRAPTGSGKTEAALLWAAAQVEDLRTATGGEPRVFYTLPYLASINAMHGRLGDELGDGERIGVAHSRAASYYLSCSLDDEDSDRSRALKALARDNATRLFKETVRVGTPYQMMRGALAGAIHGSVLLDSANSVFVFDELHAYDAQRLGMILGMIGFWRRVGSRVAVLSATMPTALAELVGDALGERLTVLEPGPGYTWPIRHRVRMGGEHLTEPASLRAVQAELASGAAVLVVANSVGDAQSIYRELKPSVEKLHGEGSALLLHSRFQRRHRSKIEDELLARFGTGSTRSPGLLVATQAVEVSLDLDFDMLHTSAAPLEALLQRFGRVNRLGLRPPADVVIHAPAYRARRGGRNQYADGVYEREPTELAWNTLAEVDGQVVDERSVTGWLDSLYKSEWGGRWQGEVAQARRNFEDGFLSFQDPFHDRSGLEERYYETFDGVEAVLAQDVDAYSEALRTAGRRAGRLLAEEYLLPLPAYGKDLVRWDKTLKVPVIDGDYDPEHGLTAIRPRTAEPKSTYRPGELV